MQYVVEAVGTDNGRSCLFLRSDAKDTKDAELIVYAETQAVMTLAGKGLPVRNTNEVAVRRRRT